MSGAALDQAADYSQRHGGASGCVIRHGYLVKEWGSPTALADIKSATKGAFGATVLGLAVDAGLVRLDDKARLHSPQLGGDRPENRGDWLGEITLRHLATMTAGFDDSRPAKLVNRPGTSGIYSNDTANLLADLLTLKYRRRPGIGHEAQGHGPDRDLSFGLALARQPVSTQDHRTG